MRVVEYNSHNTERLDVKGMKALLMKLGAIKALVDKNHIVKE